MAVRWQSPTAMLLSRQETAIQPRSAKVWLGLALPLGRRLRRWREASAKATAWSRFGSWLAHLKIWVHVPVHYAGTVAGNRDLVNTWMHMAEQVNPKPREYR